MTAGKSLKEQNAWLIRAVLLIHVLAFAYVAFEPFPLTQFSAPDFVQKIQGLLAPGSISLAIIAIARLILLGLIPASLRDRLIHWRCRHPLPGSRAFTSIGPKDSRVDMARLENVYGPLPTDPAQQGALFYSIYKPLSNEVGVLDSHKSYLAARDIATINLIFFFLLPPFAYWASHDAWRTAIYAAAVFASYILISLAAQIYGVRLVENSLAAASNGAGANRE